MRLLEMYTTIQGEGPHTGEPTQFVRFAGCNLRCPGWPCDTQHAIEPELWKPVALKRTGTEVADKVQPWPINICITGGEPLTQRAGDLIDLIDALIDSGHTIEVFTNGTQPIPTWMHGRVRIMMDWKLQGSGEDMEPYESIRLMNATHLHPRDGVKFVVKDQADLTEAYATWLRWEEAVPAQVWVGCVWDEIDDASLVEFITEHRLPWNLNVQQHKYIWHPDRQGV